MPPACTEKSSINEKTYSRCLNELKSIFSLETFYLFHCKCQARLRDPELKRCKCIHLSTFLFIKRHTQTLSTTRLMAADFFFFLFLTIAAEVTTKFGFLCNRKKPAPVILHIKDNVSSRIFFSSGSRPFSNRYPVTLLCPYSSRCLLLLGGVTPTAVRRCVLPCNNKSSRRFV